MRAGMVGLAGLYWPMAMGRALHDHPSVEFLGAATMGADERAIGELLGVTPVEYAERFGVRLYADPEEMVVSEQLDRRAGRNSHWDGTALIWRSTSWARQ